MTEHLKENNWQIFRYPFSNSTSFETSYFNKRYKTTIGSSLLLKTMRISGLITWTFQRLSPSNICSLEAITLWFKALLSRWSWELSEVLWLIEPLFPSTSGVECGTSWDKLFIFWSREWVVNKFDITCFWFLTSLVEFEIDALLICVRLLLLPPIFDENEAPDECDDLIVGDGGGWVLFYFHNNSK